MTSKIQETRRAAIQFLGDNGITDWVPVLIALRDWWDAEIESSGSNLAAVCAVVGYDYASVRRAYYRTAKGNRAGAAKIGMPSDVYHLGRLMECNGKDFGLWLAGHSEKIESARETVVEIGADTRGRRASVAYLAALSGHDWKDVLLSLVAYVRTYTDGMTAKEIAAIAKVSIYDFRRALYCQSSSKGRAPYQIVTLANVACFSPDNVATWYSGGARPPIRKMSDIYREDLVALRHSEAKKKTKRAAATYVNGQRAPAKKAWKALHGTKCHACGFDFGEFYGEMGDGYIHFHHRRQVSELPPGATIDPAVDIVPLCSNCHDMIHRGLGDASAVDALRDIVARQRRLRAGVNSDKQG